MHRDGAVVYVWKVTPEGPMAVTVEIGRNNLSKVEIVEGLQEGDQVFLGTPPGVEAPKL